MQLGYINFSQEEKNNLYKVIQSIRDHHAIDELGIGRIRDAFSNKMFFHKKTLIFVEISHKNDIVYP